MRNQIAFMVVLLFMSIQAHMVMQYPPAFRSKYNPYVDGTTLDTNLRDPINKTPDRFPCKDFQADLGTRLGTSVATFTTGAVHNFTIEQNSASHGGGSCQIALSYDKAKSFTVIHSFMGGCGFPGNYKFTIPPDAPVARGAIFSWVWYNRFQGQAEVYMNCAAVDIVAGSSENIPAVHFASRPDLYIANLDNGCVTDYINSVEVVYPNPGPDVDVTKNLTHPGGVKGVCQPVKGIGGTRAQVQAAGASSYGNGPPTSRINTSFTKALYGGSPLTMESVPSIASTSSFSFTTTKSPTQVDRSRESVVEVSMKTSANPVKSNTATQTLIYPTSKTIVPSIPGFPSNYLSTTDGTPTVLPTSTSTTTTTIIVYPTSSTQVNNACGSPQLSSRVSAIPTKFSSAASNSSTFPTTPATSQPPNSAAPLVPSSSSSGSPTPPTSTANLGSYEITEDGTCGPVAGTTCLGSQTYGPCCSQWNWCGRNDDHCGTGCQNSYGSCGDASKHDNPGVGSRRMKNRARYWSS